jgi:hypothetical protein
MKNLYEYNALSIGIPSRHSKDVEPFFGKDMDMSLKVEKKRIVIVLEPRENCFCKQKYPR